MNLPKRFWKAAVAVEHADGWTIALDGKELKSPAGKTYRLPGQKIAEAMAAEWQAVGEKIVPADMPITQIVATATDHFPAKRQEVIQQLAAYGHTELLCYRADQPQALYERQNTQWQPWLDWAARDLAIDLKSTTGVHPVAQNPAALARLQQEIARCNDLELVALQTSAGATGSIILGLALRHGQMNTATAWALAELDHDFQAEKWGVDPEAEAPRALRRRDLEAAALFVV